MINQIFLIIFMMSSLSVFSQDIDYDFFSAFKKELVLEDQFDNANGWKYSKQKLRSTLKGGILTLKSKPKAARLYFYKDDIKGNAFEIEASVRFVKGESGAEIAFGIENKNTLNRPNFKILYFKLNAGTISKVAEIGTGEFKTKSGTKYSSSFYPNTFSEGFNKINIIVIAGHVYIYFNDHFVARDFTGSGGPLFGFQPPWKGSMEVEYVNVFNFLQPDSLKVVLKNLHLAEKVKTSPRFRVTNAFHQYNSSIRELTSFGPGGAIIGYNKDSARNVASLISLKEVLDSTEVAFSDDYKKSMAQKLIDHYSHFTLSEIIQFGMDDEIANCLGWIDQYFRFNSNDPYMEYWKASYRNDPSVFKIKTLLFAIDTYKEEINKLSETNVPNGYVVSFDSDSLKNTLAIQTFSQAINQIKYSMTSVEKEQTLRLVYSHISKLNFRILDLGLTKKFSEALSTPDDSYDFHRTLTKNSPYARAFLNYLNFSNQCSIDNPFNCLAQANLDKGIKDSLFFRAAIFYDETNEPDKAIPLYEEMFNTKYGKVASERVKWNLQYQVKETGGSISSSESYNYLGHIGRSVNYEIASSKKLITKRDSQINLSEKSPTSLLEDYLYRNIRSKLFGNTLPIVEIDRFGPIE